MARIRSIKPEIRISEKVNSWPIEVRYFWIMLWGYCDDHGRGRDNAKLIVADSYPLDDNVTHKDVEEWLQILESADVIHRYTVDGGKYLLIKNWLEHQKPSHPARSVIPEPQADSGNLPQSSEDFRNVQEDAEQITEDGSPEQGAGSREQGGGEQGKRTTPHLIPADFTVTNEMRAWATDQAPAVSIERETAEFVDYWLNAGKKKSDWTRTWKNRISTKQTDMEARGWKPKASHMNPSNW